MSDKTSTQGGIAGVAIQGSLEEASLPDVVQLLALGQKTGCLSLTEGTLRGEIYLDDGRICYAFVASRRDRIGDMLVRTGRITQQQLNAAISAQKSGRHRVSEILLASGQVQRAELLRFMQRQVEEAVYFMFTWRTGTFLFRSKITPAERTLLVSIDPESLLLEGARRVDEWSVIEKKIPSFDVVYRVDRARLKNAEVDLTEEQRHIVPLIDGARDVAGIIELAGMSEFDVGKALYGLIAAGFAQLIERRTVSRHLDYRELLAYVVREAEFADPAQRRAAARHIADCPSCSTRLKTIHVRRTGAMASVTPSVAAPAAAAAPAASPTSPPTDRRSGHERRAMERRHGERRRVRSAEWERPGVDRRSGRDRRHAERRISDRRTAASGGGGMAVMSATAHGRLSGGAGRTTGPRRPYPIEGTRPSRTTGSPTRRSGTRQRQRGELRRRDPEPASAPEPVPPPPAAAATDAPSPTAPKETRSAKKGRPAAKRGAGTVEIPDLPDETARSEPPPEASTDAVPRPEEPERPIPAAVTRHPRPEQRHPGVRSKDIQWVVSPDEADDLVRTSRAVPSSQRPQFPPAAPPSAKPGTAAPASNVEAPAAASPDVVPAPAAPAPVSAPVRAPIGAPTRAAAVAVPAKQEAPRRSPIARRVGAAAAMIALVAVGWVAASLVQGRSPATTAGTPQVSQETPPAEAQPAPNASEPRPTADQPTEAAVPPAVRPSRPEPGTAREPAPATAEREPAGAAAVPVTAPAPVALPTVGAIRGVVRDAASNAALAGVRVTIPGTDFGATTDAEGTYAITDVPAGAVSVTVAATGRPPMTRDLSLEGGATQQLDFALAAPPKPVANDADEELAGGAWAVNDLVRATEVLGVPLAVIPGLYIESIAVPETASRPRVRIAQLTLSGERIVLTETRSGAPVSGGNPRVTALRIIPASQTYPLTTGTASFGNLLVTAKAALPGDSLRALLATLVVAEPGQ